MYTGARLIATDPSGLWVIKKKQGQPATVVCGEHNRNNQMGEKTK